MAYSYNELWQMLGQATDLPYGPGQVAALEQVLRHTDAAGETELAFQTRMILTQSYVMSGEPAKSFVTFSRCLAEYDADPGLDYHEAWSWELLWYFKFAVSGLLKFPEVPLDRTYAVLDDMERRYREAGEKMQAVYHYRHLVARHIGDDDAAARWYERWVTAPRDDLSDCAGCDPDSRMAYLATTGRDAEAIAVGEAALAQKLDCEKQPQSVLGALMFPYLRTGRSEEAADAFRRSYRGVKDKLGDMGAVADHIEFCARTSNEHRGLELLERHLGWLPKAPSPAAVMSFTASGGLLLRRLTELGHGDAPVRRGEETVPAAELAAEMSRTSRELGARFDARNGTPARSAAVERVLTAEPYTTRAISLNER